MKTPITETSIVRVFEIPANQPVDSLAPPRHRLYVRPEVCRRLELDRAALMEALEATAKFVEINSLRTAANIREVISAARANFPNA
jgi:hypothetical protein